MKILYISHKPIYPKVDGGCSAMSNFLELLLANNHVVKHLTIATNKHTFNLTIIPTEVQQKVNTEAVHINTDISALGAIRSLFRREAYIVSRFHSKDMESLVIDTLKSSDYDCVILESLFTTPYIDVIRAQFKGPVYLRAHNIEYEIWEDVKQNSKKGIKKLYLNNLVKTLKNYELEQFEKLDGILAISNVDNEDIKKLTRTKSITIPYSLTPTILENDYSGVNLFHLGGMNWLPNKQASERLIILFKDIQLTNTNVQLHFIGKGTNELNTHGESGITTHGFIDKIDEFCINTGILITPITSGSGIRIKILEMMRLGVPVITTSKGAQGIDIEYNKCLLIANTDSELIDACHLLISDKALRSELGSKAKMYIAQFHSFSTISTTLNDFLDAKER